VPWVIRRIKHVSSGDGIEAKRPRPEPARRGRYGGAEA
jgi:hypothetical protein